MASSMTDSTDVQTAGWQDHSNEVPRTRVLPECNHFNSTASERLATFSALVTCNRSDIAAKVSPVRLAGSGCVFNREEEYVECIYGGKITKIQDGPVMTTLHDLQHYHNPQCSALAAYISTQEREIRLGIVNLHILKRLHNQRSMLGGTRGRSSLIQDYGVTPRIFDEVTDYTVDN